MQRRSIQCELCPEGATVYCGADEAYLCWNCDGSVHGANFIVARHLRSPLCQRCRSPTLPQMTGACCSPAVRLCPLCADDLGWSVPRNGDQAPGHQTRLEIDIRSHYSVGNRFIDDATSKRKSYSGRYSLLKEEDCKRHRSRSPSPVSVIPTSSMKAHTGDAEDTDDDSDSLYCADESDFETVSSVSSEEIYPKFSTAVVHSTHMSRRRSAEHKFEKILQRWHLNLRLRNPRSITHALLLFRRAISSGKACNLGAARLLAFLAACLWMALKLDEFEDSLPSLVHFEHCTTVPAGALLATEACLCQHWNGGNGNKSQR